VKCRLGVDDQDPEEALDRLADLALAAGADALIVHARKAWLKGLSPKENRDIPPLDHERVYRLKARLPALVIVINGGISTLAEAKAHLAHVDGVMFGRAAYQNPALLIDIDRELFDCEPPVADAFAAAEAMRPLLAELARQQIAPHRLTRHMLGLFQGRGGARSYRRVLATEATRPGAGPEILDRALACVERTREPLMRAAAA
jgi:tRNA-dihydrouridine synthase A